MRRERAARRARRGECGVDEDGFSDCEKCNASCQRQANRSARAAVASFRSSSSFIVEPALRSLPRRAPRPPRARASMELPPPVRDVLDAVAGALPGAATASNVVDSAVSSIVRIGSTRVAVATEVASAQIAVARSRLDAVETAAREIESRFFERPTAIATSAVTRAPYATAAGAVAVASLALPGTRALLWRATFGRLQSEEFLFNRATRAYESLAHAAEGRAGELAKAREAAAIAEEEMSRGRSKLRAAAKELKRLVRAAFGFVSFIIQTGPHTTARAR